MDIESTTKTRPNAMLVKTNLWKNSLGSVVFQYRFIEREQKKIPLNEKFKEALLKEICKNTPENLINKLIDLENNLFYAVKIFPTLTFKLPFGNDVYHFDLIYEGDVKDTFGFLKCLFLSLLYKSQLIEIDEYYINPFDIKETDEVALFPAFKFDFVKVDAQNYISISNEMLFSPNVDLCSLIKALKDKGVSESQIEDIFRGKLTQTKYQSWAKYFKITKILFKETLKDFKVEKNGQNVLLIDHFRRKYPFMHIQTESQPLLVGVPVNNRFETITEQKEKVLIPEMLHWIISNEDLAFVHGVDYYEHCKINKRAMNYFYMGKFMTSLVDKPQIRTELFKWRVVIERTPLTMEFSNLEFNPTLSMINPQGPSRIERNLTDPDPGLYHMVLENRLHTYVPFQEIVVAFPRDLVDKAQKMISEFSDCLAHFQYGAIKPESLVVDKDEIQSWKSVLSSRHSQSSNGRVTLCLTKNSLLEVELRHFLMSKNELFKIKNINMNETFKFDCFSAHQEIFLLNQIVGGQPWVVNEIVESTPIVVAGCVFQELSNSRFLLTFTYSWNKNFTKYISKMLIIENCEDERIVAEIGEFFAKCQKSLLSKLGVKALDYSALIYVQVCENKKLFSSFDRAVTFNDDLSHKKNHLRLLEVFKGSIENFGQKSLVSVECTNRQDISLFPSKRSVESIDKANVDYYSDFAQYKESREYLFSGFPDCLYRNFENNTRFLLVSRYSFDLRGQKLKIVDSATVNEFNIFYSVSINEANVKKWVLTNTILYGCIDYENISQYVCLPLPLKLSLKANQRLTQGYSTLSTEEVLTFNRYTGPGQLT